MNDRRCETCEFWVASFPKLVGKPWPFEDETPDPEKVEEMNLFANQGMCHRYPPTSVVFPSEPNCVSSRQPLTQHDDWCGEWQADE